MTEETIRQIKEAESVANEARKLHQRAQEILGTFREELIVLARRYAAAARLNLDGAAGGCYPDHIDIDMYFSVDKGHIVCDWEEQWSQAGQDKGTFCFPLGVDIDAFEKEQAQAKVTADQERKTRDTALEIKRLKDRLAYLESLNPV